MKTADPRGGANFDPRDIIWAILVGVNQTMLHTKYLSSRAYALWEDDFLSFSFRLPWQPEFCMEFISRSNFHKGPSQEHSCEVWWKLAQWLRRRCHLSKKLTHDYMLYSENCWPPGRGQFWPQGHNLGNLGRGKPDNATHQISKL